MNWVQVVRLSGSRTLRLGPLHTPNLEAQRVSNSAHVDNKKVGAGATCTLATGGVLFTKRGVCTVLQLRGEAVPPFFLGARAASSELRETLPGGKVRLGVARGRHSGHSCRGGRSREWSDRALGSHGGLCELGRGGRAGVCWGLGQARRRGRRRFARGCEIGRASCRERVS